MTYLLRFIVLVGLLSLTVRADDTAQSLCFYALHKDYTAGRHPVTMKGHPILGYVDNTPLLTISRLASVTASAEKVPAFSIKFTKEDAAKFAKLTTDQKGKQIAVMYGDTVLVAPTVEQPIKNGTMTIVEGDNAYEVSQELHSLVKP